jgi:hypothetical protein
LNRFPSYAIPASDIGTVVERHVVASVAEEGYSVEFFDMSANTVAVGNGAGERSSSAHTSRSSRGSPSAPES